EEQEFFAYVEDPLYQDRIKDLLSESFAKQTAFIHLKAHSRIRILNHIFQKEQEGKGRSRYRRMASRIAVAASILLCIGAVFYVFRWNMPSETEKGAEMVQSEISYLDSTQVYLTLADG